jgi:hypothetical protein
MFNWFKKRENHSKEHIRELARIRAKRYYQRHKKEKKEKKEKNVELRRLFFSHLILLHPHLEP